MNYCYLIIVLHIYLYLKNVALGTIKKKEKRKEKEKEKRKEKEREMKKKREKKKKIEKGSATLHGSNLLYKLVYNYDRKLWGKRKKNNNEKVVKFIVLKKVTCW